MTSMTSPIFSLFFSLGLSIKSIVSGDLFDNLKLIRKISDWHWRMLFLNFKHGIATWNRLHIQEKLMVLVLNSCNIMNCMRIISFEYGRGVPLPLISPCLPMREPIKNPANVRAENHASCFVINFCQDDNSSQMYCQEQRCKKSSFAVTMFRRCLFLNVVWDWSLSPCRRTTVWRSSAMN